MAIAGRPAQFAIYTVNVLRAISTVQLHLAFEMGEFNLAVAGVQVEPALARHLDVDVDAMIVAVDRNAKAMEVRIAHVNLNHIARLVLVDPNAVDANLVTCGSYFGFDSVLIPSGNVNVSGRRVDPQIGFPGQGIGL